MSQLESPAFRGWAARMGETWRPHRKLWEFCYIAEALDQRGLLAPGRRGLGFGVGTEPLPALMASRGVEVVATDMDEAAARQMGWVGSDQFLSEVDVLFRPDVCPHGVFRERVRRRVVDMNAVPDDLTGFDFCWSACSLEHVGSLDLARAFVHRSLACLRPGGVAVHTTEYNVASDSDTIEVGGSVIFRRRDLLALAEELVAEGHAIEPLDLDSGDHPADGFIDVPPYSLDVHLKLLLDGFVTTSVGLVITRGQTPSQPGPPVRIRATPPARGQPHWSWMAAMANRLHQARDTRPDSPTARHLQAQERLDRDLTPLVNLAVPATAKPGRAAVVVRLLRRLAGVLVEPWLQRQSAWNAAASQALAEQARHRDRQSQAVRNVRADFESLRRRYEGVTTADATTPTR